MSNGDLQYWDSCLFIRYLTDDPQTDKDRAQLENIKPLFEAAHKGHILIVVSTLVLAEIRPREPFNQRHYDLIDDLFYRGRSNVRVVAVTPPIARKASELGVTHKAMTSPDAVHVATALLEQVSVMYTFDGDKDGERRRSGKLLGYNGILGDPRLPIVAPPEPAMKIQGTLFDEELTLPVESTGEVPPPPGEPEAAL